MTSTNSELTVGVLSLHNSKETKAILNAVDMLGFGTEWLRRENTIARVQGDEFVLEPDIDVVVNRLLVSNTDQPTEALGLACIYDGCRPVLNPPCAVLRAVHKFATASALHAEEIPIPNAILGLDPTHLNTARSEFANHAVYKSAIGTHGGGTWLIDTSNPVQPKVGNRQAFLQEFIKTSGNRHFDYRVYVVGENVLGAMKRTASEGEFRTNVAQGGAVEDATDDLPPNVREMACDAMNAVGLDYAGVDIVGSPNGWYVLEVNPTAGFRGFFRSTGLNPAPYIAKLAIERVGGEVDDDRVTSLAAQLDDSMPACTPQPTQNIHREPLLIGYTERITVSGVHGSETVVAKSDTGATRTSIDLGLAAKLGVGPLKQRTRVRSGLSKTPTTRPLVDIVLGIKGDWYTVTANLTDRSHMSHPVLLGRDVLQHYAVDVTRASEE
ncbi:RimK family alpha-L-glutamate ligase [Haladaptatus pallidirubidus]|uniref:ATP-grasp domain-containing protein n=1 Tax=Haladaptatus pallidirubidus TaxID=1008152 RepID=A0AAV3UJL6_9EURY|nr:RimK family alpha-L-glutamate ligase [Haladaptatus pallidirubidus]